MATLKEYEVLVSRVNNAGDSAREDLARQKCDVAAKLQKQAAAKGHDAKRGLKMAMDEINNS